MTYEQQFSQKKNINITTTICEKLGYSDDFGISNTLESFRDNVMQKNLRYSKTLFEYDVIDPKIAEIIRGDKDDKIELWTLIYNFYLSAIANFIREERYDKAVERYAQMIADLKDYYGINEYIHEITQNYDISKGGHVKVNLPSLKEEI